MTVAELIQRYNTERQNALSDTTKMQWLRKCERMVINDVILTHELPGVNLEDADNIEHPIVGTIPTQAYVEDDVLHFNNSGIIDNDDEFGMETGLIIPEPYDDVYMYYIDQRIAYNNNDMRRYNTASQLFNNAYITFQQWYNRHHAVRQPKPYLLRHEVL